jgi:hypothetical protein
MKMLYQPRKVCNIIVATAVLHNAAIDHNKPKMFKMIQAKFQFLQPATMLVEMLHEQTL